MKAVCLWLLLVSMLLLDGCGDSTATPPVDSRYSEALSVLGSNYAAISGDRSSATVGVVQIFSGGKRGATTWGSATAGELLFESRRRDVIDELIDSLQHGEPSASDPCDLGAGPAWILVAYDSQIFRIAVIRLYACGSAGSVVGVVPMGDAAIHYSSETANFLRSHGLTEKPLLRDR